MTLFPDALSYWQTAAFGQTLKTEVEKLSASALPLEQAISQSSYVGDHPITATVIQAMDARDAIQAKVGVFFTEIVASCGCGDDPMEQDAYCEMRVRIDKSTAEAAFAVITG